MMRAVGLDIVELVMAVEEVFKIEIDDIDAEQLVTVGDLHKLILRGLEKRGETPDPEKVWNILRDTIFEQCGVRLDEITPDATFVDDLRLD